MRAKLKVLHTMTWLAPGGGADQNVLLTIRGLMAEQEIHLAVGKEIHHNPFQSLDGIKVWVCPDLVRPIRPWKDLKAFWYFYKLIRSQGYDVVHTHETKSSFIARLAAALAGCPRIIYGLHGVCFNDPLSRARRVFYIWLERLTIGVSHVVVAVSQSVVDEYRNNRIGGEMDYRVVYSGVDVDAFESKRAKSSQRRSELRRRLGVADEDLLLVNMGRFSHAKAQRHTIEAFALLRRRRGRLKLLLVGEGELKEACRRQAASLGVADDVVFYGFTDNVPEVLSLADLHVLTSLREGLPRVVVESYLVRVPAVAFEVEGIREIIEDGVTGFVVPQYDVAALADRAQVLLADPEKTRRFGELGWRRAAAGWNHREMVCRLREIYESRGRAASALALGRS